MSYTLVLEWMPGDLYMSAVTARCTAPTSSYSVVWLPPNKVYQITLYCGSTSLVSFLVGAFRGKAWSYMKKTSISIDMEAEKLRALRFYTEKKETTLETELEDFLAKLYEKYVPAQTREYIESMEEPAEPPRPRIKRQPRAPVDTPTAVSEEVV